MVENLAEENVRDVVQLYRSLFARFLGNVNISYQDEALAGLIRMRVIPSLFRKAPVVPIPDIRTNVPDILFILTESLECFDKDLIRSAFSHSYKSSTVPVNGHRKTAVPRESVYDTELMRILTNWLSISESGWSVTITDDERHK